ncbi:NfeD family protein [Natronoflexus pectinivorans]|uniref:NfeD-like partner-binding protein n=1 Tax=Natronoflexus pectinivorans TaxID=682526 RepID=A0A4R2GH73_9BACT|nr:NfeD family protein [Natronoflexus pectinivorans]TCO07402.1 NfeD-like partner-binding protein [Natronoflexus pectinivorans]
MTIIILLILTGLLLLVLEFFVFPGMTISGIGGVFMMAAGIYMAYNGYGSEVGNWTLFITIFSSLLVLGLALRGKTWNKLMLNTQITGNVQTVTDETIHEGDKGFTVTRLNPIGKARINDEDVEARCPGQFVDPGTEIEVLKVYKTYVIVKPVN